MLTSMRMHDAWNCENLQEAVPHLNGSELRTCSEHQMLCWQGMNLVCHMLRLLLCCSPACTSNSLKHMVSARHFPTSTVSLVPVPLSPLSIWDQSRRRERQSGRQMTSPTRATSLPSTSALLWASLSTSPS